MKVVRVEKIPKAQKWCFRSRRILQELPVFFPEWAALKNVEALFSELYWVQLPASEVPRVVPLLKQEVLEDILHDVSASASGFPQSEDSGFSWWCLEKKFRPGVTDNAGQAFSEALLLVAGLQANCRSGARLWLRLPSTVTQESVQKYADQVFHNGLIEKVDVVLFGEAKKRDSVLFENPEWVDVKSEAGAVERFDLSARSVEELKKLSDEKLWAFSVEELAQVRGHYLKLGRLATDVEIEVLAQTWSEHCKHKIFSAKIDVENQRTDVQLPAKVDSVFKTYIRGATKKTDVSYLKSVFEDNAGIFNVTPEWDCAIKVETHNSPSALDPYGGALTGIVGVNRDILGAGMGSYPVANLDVFCVGPLDYDKPLPPRLHHPRRILEGVRTGVEHGGNKSGIPNITGAVVHHDKFLGKPLVFCGTLGLLPANRALIEKRILPGDSVVVAGGRVGKDGIHGATFSSLEMNESSPVSAVQLGDPLTQKRVWDFLIEARDESLFRAVTDNGAGGVSSSIGELARLCGAKGGARIDVKKAKSKYPGLKPFELVVSESQERMSFAVPKENLDAFLKLAESRGVECSVLGQFEDSGFFRIDYGGELVGELEMHFLHEGVPQMQLRAKVKPPLPLVQAPSTKPLQQVLLNILGSPNVRSRRGLVQQYDHEVQARTVRKPYGSQKHAAPADGGVLRLSRTTFEGIAVGLGLAPALADYDPKVAAEMALDEALRNAVASGMNPEHAVLVDNFCWPDPLPSATNLDAQEKLGALVVTCQAIHDAAITLNMPFVSGKDSMKNDYRMGNTKISVPPTLLITVAGKVDDVRAIPSAYAKVSSGLSGSLDQKYSLLWIGASQKLFDQNNLPIVQFNLAKRFYKKVHEQVLQKNFVALHDVSDGGFLCATAELGFGAAADFDLNVSGELAQHLDAGIFQEPASCFVALVNHTNIDKIRAAFREHWVLEVGEVSAVAAKAVVQTGPQGMFHLALETSRGTQQYSWSFAELEKAYGHQ